MPHAALLPFLDRACAQQENALFMVTELCDGGDFSELNHGIDDPQAWDLGPCGTPGGPWPWERLCAYEGNCSFKPRLLGPLGTSGEVKLLIRDVVMALAYCHDHGVAHRDLEKPPLLWR
eukprot:Skav233704  [mRNA]  locus=scaffold1927:436181:436705:+ [translate_table: standard]